MGRVLYISFNMCIAASLAFAPLAQADVVVDEAGFDRSYTSREVVDEKSPSATLNAGDIISTSSVELDAAEILTKSPDGRERQEKFKEGVKIKSSALPTARLNELNRGLPLLMRQNDYDTKTEALTGSSERRVRQAVPIFNSQMEESASPLSSSAAQQLFQSFAEKSTSDATCSSSSAYSRKVPSLLENPYENKNENDGISSSGMRTGREKTRLNATGHTMRREECSRLPSNGYDPGYTFDDAQAMGSRLAAVAATAGLNSCAISHLSKFVQTDFGRIQNRRFVSAIDFSKPPSEKRWYILDLKTGNFQLEYAADGANTDYRNFNSFSSRNSSNQTPLGMHITKSPYYSKKMGRCALQLKQVTRRGRNPADCSESRGVVMHGAEYCHRDSVRRTGSCGKTQGCPGVPEAFFNSWVGHLAGGSVLYHFHKGMCRSTD